MKSILFFCLSCVFFLNVSAADWFAFATDILNFQVVPYDIQTQTVTTEIPSGRCVELAITPDASTIYTINSSNPNSVSIIDVATKVLQGNIDLNAGGVDQTPFGIAITPDGTTAYITATDPSNVHNVLKFDLATNTYIVIPLVPDIQSDALAITPDGSTIYFTQTDAIVSMTTAGNVFGTPIQVPAGRTTRIALAPSGNFAYVTDMINSKLYEINLTTQTVSNTITLTPNSQPTNLAVSADGNWIFIANQSASFTTSIHIPTSFTKTDIPLGEPPIDYSQYGVAISPDSKIAIVSNVNRFSAITIGTNAVTNTLAEVNPNFMAITPDQAPTASFTAVISEPNIPSTFTSTSTSPVGTIVSYFWDFGDGNTLQTTTNPVEHTYTTSGAYTIILTVTNSGGTSTTQTFTGQTVSNNGGPSASITNAIDVPYVIFPATDGFAYQAVDKFATQTDYVNVLSWDPPTIRIVPVAYEIYSDADLTNLIAIVNSGTYVEFHNQIKNRRVVYYVVSIGPLGERSMPLVVVL